MLTIHSTKNPLQPLSPGRPAFTALLGLLAGLPALSIDLSAPTLAILPAALHTTISTATLSLSLFMVGFAVGQFVGGRGSDLHGRRPTLLIALAIYVFGGICCSFATSGDALATARALQGLGAGGCSVQAFAMVQDLFEGELARRKQSYVTVVLTIMPMIAPALGAVLLDAWGWRSVHLVLTVAGALLAAIVFVGVKESRASRSTTKGLGLNETWRLLRSHSFRRVALSNSLSYGAIFAYIAGAPFVIVSQFGYPNYTYAAVFAMTALALSGGAMFSARQRAQRDTLLSSCLIIQAATGLGLALVSSLAPARTAWIALPLLVVFCFVRGVISPNFVHLALRDQRGQAGLTSAVLGLAQLLLGAAASAIVAGLLPAMGGLAVAGVIAVLSCSAVLTWGRPLPVART